MATMAELETAADLLVAGANLEMAEVRANAFNAGKAAADERITGAV